MRKRIFLLLCCVPFLLSAQHTYTEKEISRLADLGKVWGMLHNFHPGMARGMITTDSLVTDVAESLAKDPSADNFKKGLQTMLARLRDPLTRVVTNKDVSVKLFMKDSLPSYQLLPESILYVSFPTIFASNDTVKKFNWLEPKQLGTYKGLILDLRNKPADGYGDYAFMQSTGDLIFRTMIKKPLNTLTSMYRYQAGFLDQSNRSVSNNIYSAGWQTNATETIQPAAGAENWKSTVVVVINRFVTEQLLQYLLALQSNGYCRIVFDGAAEDYRNASVLDLYTDADSIHFTIRIADFIASNGKTIRQADLFINGIDDEKTFLEKCRQLIVSVKENDPAAATTASLDYTHPYPTDTNNGLAPVGSRLFGLYNYWNAIAYFAPYKYLLKESWDSVLTTFIPKFINANDSLNYYFTVRELITHVHDSHGFFRNNVNIKAFDDNYRYAVPLTFKQIAGKYFIVSIGQDSSQDLGKFKLWDELIAIDDIPVNTYKQQFRTRFAASNDWTFERDICSRNYLVSGANNSIERFTVLREGKTIKLEAKRSSFTYLPDFKAVDFNDDHKDIELLKNNIGYVNMGSLSQERVNAIFDTFMQATAIIFDIRNYPRGTAWSIVPRLTDRDSVAVKFDKPYVTYESIYMLPAVMNKSEYFKVSADRSKPYYKGKIIMLCNENTQSQAEYTIMMFQGAAGKRVTVIGSPTAGADGNVTAITLPGGFITYFSGLGVLYPDGAQTQQTGIRIDILSQPTLAGLKAGKDEVLERAIQFAETGK